MIRAGLKSQRFRLLKLSFVLQIIGEPWPQDVRAKVLAGGTPKINVAQLVAGRAIPSAMIPRAGNQIVNVIRVGLLQNLIRLDGSIEVFLVPPTSDVHDRHGDLLELVN